MAHNELAPKATTRLCHHRLHVWHYSIQLVRLVKAAPIGDRELRDQAERACRSVALNTAEGAALEGAALYFFWGGTSRSRGAAAWRRWRPTSWPRPWASRCRPRW